MRGQSDPQPDYSVTDDAIIASVHYSGKSGSVRITIWAENEPMFMAKSRQTIMFSLVISTILLFSLLYYKWLLSQQNSGLIFDILNPKR